LLTFARASIGSQFVTGWALATEATGSVDTFTAAAQSGGALALVDIWQTNNNNPIDINKAHDSNLALNDIPMQICIIMVLS
jgi:hypothetical protein